MRNLVVLACVALVATPAMPSTKPLAPSSKWVVDFGDNRCVAQRIYGDAAEPVYLLLKAPAIGDGLQLSIAVKGPNGYGVQERAKLFFGGPDHVALSQLRYGVDKKQVRMVNLTRSEIDRLSGATELRWDTANLDYSLPLGSIGDLIKVMEECRTGLADYWNGTADKRAALKQEARSAKPVVKLFRSEDYPSQALIGGQSGTTMMVALVDEKGEMVDCTIVATSNVAVLDAQTCLIVRKRGRFSPAIGADGQPVKGVFAQRIRWETE